MQFHPVQMHLHAEAGGVFGQGPVRRKDGQRQRAVALRIERFEGAAPTLTLAVIDLAQIEHGPLHHLAARTAARFDNAPVTMLLAIFEPPIAFQEHDGHRSYTETGGGEEAGSILQSFSLRRPVDPVRLATRFDLEKTSSALRLRKSG